MKPMIRFFFCIGVLHIGILCGVVEEGAWKPSKMPKTAQEAERLEQQAAKEEELLRKKLATERDAVERARLEEEKEKIDYDIETYESAKINLGVLERAARDRTYAREHGDIVNSARETLAQRGKEIQEKITAYEEAISKGGQIVDGDGQEKTSYETALDNKLSSIPQTTEQIKFFRQELNMLDSGKSAILKGEDLTNYVKRKEILTLMLDKVRKEILRDKPEFKDIRDRIAEYLQEIENFERTAHIPLTGNKLDQQLELAYRIPRDQVRELKKILNSVTFEKSFPDPAKKFEAAIEARQALDAYKIYNEALQNRIQEILSDPDVVTVRMRQEKIATEQLRILDEALAQALKESDYAKQRELLQEIVTKDINPFVAREGFRIVQERARDRLAQIDTFLRSHRKMPMTKNALDRELNLSQKLPADQMQALWERIELFGYLEDPATLNKENVALLKDARDAMSYYGLDKEFLIQAEVIDSAIAKASPKPAERPTGVSEAELTGDTPLAVVLDATVDPAKTPEEVKKTLLSKFISGGKLILDSIAKFVTRTAGTIHEGIRYKINTTGKSLQHKFTAPETITMMANMPKTFEKIVNAIVEFDKKGGGVFAGIAKADIKAHIKLYEQLTGDKETAEQLRAFVDGGYKDTLLGKEGAAGVEAVNKVRDIVNKIGTAGTILKSIIEMPKWFGEQLEAMTRTQEDHYVLKRFDEASRYIEDERRRMAMKQQEISEKLPYEQVITDVLASWGKQVHDIFRNIDLEVKTAQDKYTQARKEFLDLLGLPETATQEAIEQGLRKKESLIYDDLVKATEKMVDATVDLVNTYKTYITELEQAQVNVEFLVNAWDSIRVTPDADKIQFIEFVRGTFALRELRVQYLKSMLDSVKQLEQARTDIARNEVRQWSKEYNEALEKIISERLFGTIVDYGKAIHDMEALIEQQKSSLKKRSPKTD